MQHPMTTQVHYDEYRSHVAWVNENDWQFERAVKRYPVRQTIAKALITLATRIAPGIGPGTVATAP
jgi:hypothetical protein